MEGIVEIVRQLGAIRNVPQLIFIDNISPYSMIETRKTVSDFKNEYPEIEEIDFVINSPGGSPADAYPIIRSLRNTFEVVNVIVPFWAKSAATLLSIGANTIIMDEYGELGPLDMQLSTEREDSFDHDTESALIDESSLKRIEARAREQFLSMFLDLHANENFPIPKTELSQQLFGFIGRFYEPLLTQINPYKLGQKKRKLDIGEQYAQRVVARYHQDIPLSSRNLLIDYLVNGCPDHGYVIDYEFICDFLPYVKKSNIFGKKYARLLGDLSLLFMIESGEKALIGFVFDDDTLKSKSVGNGKQENKSSHEKSHSQ